MRAKGISFWGAAKMLSAFVGCCSLSACGLMGAIPGMGRVVGDDGIFRDSQGDYLDAGTIPRTEVPANLDNFVMDDLLVVPNAIDDDIVAFLEVPRPPALVGSGARGIVIQSMDEKSWVVVDASAGEVWPRVKDYWTSNGVGMSFENPTAGILDTEWFVEDNNVLTREKIRIIVEAGFQDNSAEIKLLHLSIPQSIPVGLTADVWPEASDDPEVEYKFLTSLSNYLADVADLYQASSVSFLAGNIPSEGKAVITTDSSGENLLRLNADYSRSWAAVGRALTRAGVEIVSEDRTSGTYEVSYVIDKGEAEKQGLFGKMVTLNGLIWDPDEEVEPHSLQVQLLDEGSNIDVFIQSLESEEEQLEPVEEIEESLLTVLRNFIT